MKIHPIKAEPTEAERQPTPPPPTLFHSFLIKAELSEHVFVKDPNVKFHENSSYGSRTDRKTGRHNAANSHSSQLCDKMTQLNGT